MPDLGSVRSILVKGRLPAGVISDVPGRPLGFTGIKDAKVQLNVRPLFASIGHDGMLGAVAPATWHMVDMPWRSTRWNGVGDAVPRGGSGRTASA